MITYLLAEDLVWRFLRAESWSHQRMFYFLRLILQATMSPAFRQNNACCDDVQWCKSIQMLYLLLYKEIKNGYFHLVAVCFWKGGKEFGHVIFVWSQWYWYMTVDSSTKVEKQWSQKCGLLGASLCSRDPQIQSSTARGLQLLGAPFVTHT